MDPGPRCLAGDEDGRTRVKLEDRLHNLEGTVRWSTVEDLKDPIEGAFTHEGWHAVFFRLDLVDRWAANLKKFNVTKAQWYEVSEYAGTSVSELFAEAGSAIDGKMSLPGNIKKAFNATVEGK